MASKTNSGDNPRWRFIVFFQEKHVPGISGRVLVILNSKMMKILIIYCILGFKNQLWRQPGWPFFLFPEKTRPWNFGTCFGDFEFTNYENPD